MYEALAIILAMASVLGLVFWWTRSARQDGANEEKLSYSRETLEQIREANKIRERVRNDSAYRNGVRKRFDK